MSSRDPGTKIRELEQQIAALPRGSIGTKDINGKEYFYHRWYEGKKRREKYVPAEEVEELRSGIQKRKALEAELKKLRSRFNAVSAAPAPGYSYLTNVRTGSALISYSAPVEGLRKRECFQVLHDYVYGPHQDKVLILYGLRRTGKTTLIRQLLREMTEEDLTKAAFIQITSRDTLASVNQDLRRLEEAGYRYVFCDEVTLMEDFIAGAAIFSDVFAAGGMKIVLSGTDSLGFLFSEDEQLYDRCILLHTTFIPYQEFERVLGIQGIDEYIRYGGTMSLGGVHYNETSTFASKESADQYVDSAIARNIQHSLKYYQEGGHFRHLLELYEKDELTSAINRIVEDYNHRFTLEVLTRDFKSGDLSISQRNLRRDRNHPNDILDRIDMETVTERLRTLLEIRNRQEQSVMITDAHRIEIQEYLRMLDLIHTIPVISFPTAEQQSERTVLAQPGLRYAQADALVKSLMADKIFLDLSLSERNYVLQRILNEIKGRMMEDSILLETTLAYPKKQVFVLQFAIGEFDMVIFDPVGGSCEIFEIKHSKESTPEQYRHLIDPEKCKATEHRYGPIQGKYVFYRGETQTVNEIQYVKVEEYLKSLKFLIAVN